MGSKSSTLSGVAGSEDSAGGVLGGGLGGLGERERGETAIEMGIWKRLQSMGLDLFIGIDTIS